MIRTENGKVNPMAVLKSAACAAALAALFELAVLPQPEALCSPQPGVPAPEIPGLQNSSNTPIQDYLAEAEKYYKEGKFGEALSLWDKALEADPANSTAAEGVKNARIKIAKIKDFFGSAAFEEFGQAKQFSIDYCMKVASENSIPLEVARQQIKMAEMKVWEAQRAFFPALTLSWTTTSGIQSGGKVKGVEYGVEGKQPAFHSGSIMYALAQAKVDLAIAESNFDKAGNELYFEVAKAYYGLVKAKRKWEFAEYILGEMKPVYETAKKAHENSLTPDIEFLNAESNFNQLYYQAISGKNEFELAKLALEQKLSIEEVSDIDIAADEEKKTINKDIKTCLELALENRPDLKMGLYTVKYTEYGRKIADAKEMPAVDLVGNYKKSAEVFRESFNSANQVRSLDPHRKWYVGIEASMPFLGNTASYSYFRRHDPPSLSTYLPDSEARGTTLKLDILNNMKNLTEIEGAKIANIKAEQDLEDTRKKAILEVKEAYYGYEKARIQLEAAMAQKEFREKEFKLIKFKSGVGEVELSEIFDRAVKLLEANGSFFEANAGLDTSIAGLNKAIGIEDYF